MWQVPMPGSGLSLEELVPPRIATHVKSASSDDSQDGNSDNDSADTAAGSEPGSATAGLSAASGPPGAPSMDALHFFGVFDGCALHAGFTLQ